MDLPTSSCSRSIILGRNTQPSSIGSCRMSAFNLCTENAYQPTDDDRPHRKTSRIRHRLRKGWHHNMEFFSKDKTMSNLDDDSSASSVEFDFIESTYENDVETGVKISWPNSPRALQLTTKLEQEEIAPLFNGVQWAGTRIWKAAVLALEYLLEKYPNDPKSMLELGCGLGLPGMLWYLLNDETNKVVLTDQPSLVSQLMQNVEKNFDIKSGLIQAKALSWSEAGLASLLEECGEFDICLNCDCIYEPLYGRDSWEALADLLDALAERSPKTLLVTSVERRNGDGLESFFERLLAKGNVAPIKKVLRNDEDKHHIIEIYITHGIQ